jgi:uncharacterized protein (TIGR02217 family)
MAFHEVLFPTGIAFKSTAGPVRKTEIASLGSGFEERNAVWANSRRSYNAGYGVKTLDDIYTVIAFFEARNARLYGFRFRDFSDLNSCRPLGTPTAFDQSIGAGDGTTKTFQLQKTYGDAAATWVRTIKKPVAGSVLVGKGGVAQSSGWTVDTTTGIVTFTTAPALGAAITAGFVFDVPVRFDTDQITVNLDNFRAGDIPTIPLVEIRV